MTMTTKPRLSKHGNFMPIDAGQDADPTKSPPFHIGGSAAEAGEQPTVVRVLDAVSVTIERCAQVAEDKMFHHEDDWRPKAIAAAIRALKDK